MAPTQFATDDARWPAVPSIRRQPRNYPFVVDAYPRRLYRLARYSIIFASCGAVWGGIGALAWWLL